MKQFIVLPQRNGNPFNKESLIERITTIYSSKEKAQEEAVKLAIQYHGTSFHVFELLNTFVAEIKEV